MRVNSLFGLTVKLICILPIYQFWFWVKEDYSLNCGTPCIIYFYTFVQKRKKKRKEALYHLCLYIYTKKGKIKEKKEALYHDTRLLGHMAARKKAGGPSSPFLAGGPPPHLSSPLLSSWRPPPPPPPGQSRRARRGKMHKTSGGFKPSPSPSS